jgi:hypothetical protein
MVKEKESTVSASSRMIRLLPDTRKHGRVYSGADAKHQKVLRTITQVQCREAPMAHGEPLKQTDQLM